MRTKKRKLSKNVVIVRCEEHNDILKLSKRLDFCENKNKLDVSLATLNAKSHAHSNKNYEIDVLIINGDYAIYPKDYPVYVALYKNGKTTLLDGDYDSVSIGVSDFVIDTYYWSTIDYSSGERVYKVPYWHRKRNGGLICLSGKKK